MKINLPEIRVETKGLRDINEVLRKEWIVTNGLGGYASSTVLGLNTRKYHGLLVAAFNPPVDRRVLLSKLDEEIVIGSVNHLIGTNEFKHGLHPRGYSFLSYFSVNPFPTFGYRVLNIELEKTVFMVYEQNMTIVRYVVLNHSKDKVKIRITPLVNSRHFHSVTNNLCLEWNFVQKQCDQGVILEPSIPISSLLLFSSIGRYVRNVGEWIEELYFREEANRGESYLNDEFDPGFFEVEVGSKKTERFHLIAAACKNENEARVLFSSMMEFKSVEAFFDSEVARRQSILGGFRNAHRDIPLEDWLKWFILAADTFIVRRELTQTKSMIAGYHWFEDWGRDSLISLPGLTLVTGWFDDAREILLTFLRYCHEGIVPNRFPDFAGGNPVYNTVDATLWYFNAVLHYLKYTGDFDFIKEKLWDGLKAMLEHHLQGTLNGIHVEKDGLIAHRAQLTWMDAKVGDRVVTPREGKAVEIQALWYNALKIVELLARRFNEKMEAEKCSVLAETAKRSFIKKFWNSKKDCLFDVVNGRQGDSSVRPNQVMAVSLDFSMLDKARSEKAIKVVWNRLWGAYGLKTLPEDDPRYIGIYIGDRNHRDNAYHNGTVWAWLLGPFVTAFLKVKNYKRRWRTFAFETFLKPLFLRVFQAGLGTINEIFDGDTPHTSRGCIAQAWSIAEPLRAYMEDILMQRPPYERLLTRNGDPLQSR